MNEPTAKVALINEDGDVETLWAFALGESRYRLDNLPFLNYRVSLADVVEATPDPDGLLVMRRIVEKSGNRTVRVIQDKEEVSDKVSYESNRVLDQLEELGCGFERATGTMLAINVPQAVSLADVAHILTTSGLNWEYADPTYDDLFPDTGASRAAV